MRTEHINLLFNVSQGFRIDVLPERRGELSAALEGRVRDDGEDVTHLVRSLTVCRDVRRTYSEVEYLNRDGFDGPFCTLPVPF